MCDTEGNKHICILDNLSDCQQPYQHIHLKEKKIASWYTNAKNSFSEKKLPLVENVRIKSLTCFKYQINIMVVLVVLRRFLPSN